ncbi:hypothetical protein RHGRI_028546 [Rhododendron griersonianum]|uniref:Ninja-family protein n=1 Tax=Rhododendron griersonianum TaxID=479676 RepID=A0AAV6ILT0_9ERIC|nr:hypothetical protein RHGRI_028546 [Rhododendron griersonianum]KAG5527655.1 hypothetical protein RHGRI_028546 [Rhododendron griersonianum]
MGEAEKQRDTNNPRDLIQTLNFSNFLGKFEESVVTTEDDEESIELSLGLSLNGRFGVDPQREKILSRSSSVSAFIFTNEKQGNENRVCVGQGLMRTCSLPAEGEEEWRKRKVAQTARRMEAKRKRVEKLRNLKSQGSGESSFGESLKSQGMNGCTEARSPASVHSLPKQNEQKQVVTPTVKSADFVGAAMESPSVKLAVDNAEATEIMRNMLVDMPCVSTRGFGPNGKRVEGFLYRYRKGEQVRIVCVCHGSFLSPAEFVKHAGGGDVSHPLKHIVVSPSPLL